jgi:PAS domain S-box-containing protein
MRLALRASSMGTFEWDIARTGFQYSDRLAEIFGYSDPKNLTHHHFINRIHPDDSEVRVKAHEEAFKTGTLFYEVRVVWPDDSIHWVRLNGYTLFDKSGKPTRMYGTTLDITEAKLRANELEKKVKRRTRALEEKNEELKRSEERYVKMTEEVQDYAIILLDKDGTILNWNKGAEKIKGYREEEIVGKNFSIFYLEQDRMQKLPQTLIRKAVEEGRAMHEGWRRRKDGTEFWGSVVITALHGDDKEIIGFTKVTRDLTERKLAEDLMRQHTAELEIKNQQLEQFAYIASHDLQEPLRKIQTFVQVLDKKIDNTEARQRYIEKIKSSAKRMGELIQSVLNYSRLSQTDQLWVSTDLNLILENVKTDYELLIIEKNAVIESDPLPSVKGIPHQLSQLFANLIGNSLKFVNDKPIIAITANIKKAQDFQSTHPRADESKRYLELNFKDNGIGFEQQYAEKIFTIFQRLNSREEYAGTGIGLALCKRIVDNHHGFISATGEAGNGATFHVYLPIE